MDGIITQKIIEPRILPNAQIVAKMLIPMVMLWLVAIGVQFNVKLVVPHLVMKVVKELTNESD
jgi:hypothetical protein